ncbi:non-homologous end-joining DNA ligase [Nocardia huaxiensis]|nr:non-homologous end-joining DNA ligase [Nocardia huaxiensis]
MAAARRPVPAPMLAVAGAPPDGPGWAVEMKWDGVRVIAVREGGECALYGRSGKPAGPSYPELVQALKVLPGKGSLILDGEIVALDEHSAPSFGLLQRRMHVARPGAGLIAEVPVRMFAFDLLVQDDRDIMAEPYLERRRRLAELAFESPISAPPHWIGVEAEKLLKVAADHHLEGIVSKRTDSLYLPGRRSPAWIKTPLRANTEAVVAGWTPGAGGFGATFGSLVLGAHDETGGFVFIGLAGTGFTQAARRAIRAALDEIETSASPFADPPVEAAAAGWHWVQPILVGEIEYREFAGARLRMPSWKGLRTDKIPAEVQVPPTRGA